jgi:hypothetical protein
MEVKPVKVQADIMWAFLDTPNQMSGKYQVDLCNLTKGAVEALEGMGIPVYSKADKPEKGHYITAKSFNYPIKAEDMEGNPITAKVGNGSRGIALINPYQYSYKGKKGVGAGINKLVVTDLKVYEGETVTADDDVL